MTEPVQSISTNMLESFVKVAELGSVSRAAMALGISKSVISKRVYQLEAAVSATLFSRSNRRLGLTPAGEIYVDYARRALATIEMGNEGLRTLRSDPTGLIRVTAPISWGQRVLARVIADFLQAYPSIEIELLLFDRMLDIAYDGIDIALRMTAEPALDLVSIPLVKLDWMICAAPDYLARAGIPQHPNDLHQHSCMNYWSAISDQSWQLESAEESIILRVQNRYRANNPEAVADAALAGLGIALLPLYVCEQEINRGRLQRLLPQWHPITRYGNRITVVAAPDRIGFSRNQAFLKYLKQRFSKPDEV